MLKLEETKQESTISPDKQNGSGSPGATSEKAPDFGEKINHLSTSQWWKKPQEEQVPSSNSSEVIWKRKSRNANAVFDSETKLQKFLRSFLLYYAAQMFINVLCLFSYAVIAFTPHEDCVPAGGQSSVTGSIVMVFIIGFGLHAVNFVIATFVEPILRKELQAKIEKNGFNSETRRLFYTSFLLEHILRVILVLFSLYEIITAGNPGIVFCSTQSDALAVPAAWCFNLALLQIVTVPGFTLWRWLVKFDYGKEEEAEVKLEVEYEKGPVDRLSDVASEEDAWLDGSDVSNGERDNINNTRKFREFANKQYN